ncbi:MAG: hypothetical protein RL325_1571, partial [Planctomycetota bacterium]
VDVEPGVDPMPEFERAWARGARVLPLARALPAAAREELAARVRAVRCERAPGIVLATSGSSGVPRLVDIPLDAMRASAGLGARAIPFGAGDTWHASLAPAHIGGVMILMRARFLGGSVRFGAQPRAWSDLAGCTHASLVATQLARLLDDPSPVPPSLKAVMLGGGPSPRALHERAIGRGVPLFSTYGLTETCSQVATGRRAAGDAETLAGPPLPGVSIAIDAAGGEILVDGPVLARGEFADGALVPLARPLRTRDAGFLDAQGRLHVVGRLDAMFISGGKNIHPESIERALCALEGVLSACVVGVPDAKWGMRPVAFVARAAGADGDLRAPLRERLEPHLVPDAILAMPTDEAASMKPSRARLAARLAAGERFETLG